MRTLKDIRELYEPKAADEKRFADKHIVKKTKDANGNGDDVFNAKNVKSVRDDKKEKNHGYPPGKDEEVYEQKKMESCDDDDENDDEDEDEDDEEDKMKKEGFVSHAQRKAVWATKKDGGKGHPDNKKKMKEEIEQVDEVLKPSMGVKAYIDDFVKSDDPRFKGASKKERIKRAVAAYYAAKRTQ